RYFNGLASRGQLAPYVAIEYAGPDALREEADRAETLITFQEPLPQSLVLQTNEADFFALRGENVAGGRVYVRPAFSSFFNDPSGAFRYDLSIVGNYSRALAEQTFLQAQAYLPLYENISDVTSPSNSELPHVRSDIAEYRRHNHLKLSQLLVNRFYHSSERVYARLSGGIYEEMFSGAGGQVLYLPRDGRWGADLDVNWLNQRDFDYDLPSLGTGRDRIWPDLVADDFFSGLRAAGEVDWLRTAALGTGIVVGSALLDHAAWRFAERHKDAHWMKQGIRVGNALPVAVLGLSAVFAFDESRPRLSDTGVAA